MTISKDRVKPSPQPDSWKLAEIFATGIILGSYLALMTVIFFWVAYKTDFFAVSRPVLQKLMVYIFHCKATTFGLLFLFEILVLIYKCQMRCTTCVLAPWI